MTKRSPKKAKKKTKPGNDISQQNGAWLPTRGGLIAVGVASLLLAAWTTIQSMKVSDFGESLLWGLGFGASIWVIFGFVFVLNKFLRGR
ncbi:MAG: hypothetical protein WAM60_14520 [Candidatus Promineifilaceae bacterium]